MQYLAELNDYFAELCWDSAYKRPTPAQVESGVQVPEISERQVWNSLQHLKKTMTGPDLIPFWVWRHHAEIFTSLIFKIWNLSLRFSTWPSSWKRAHVTPLSKVDVRKGKTDYRGININPVINLEISIDNHPPSGVEAESWIFVLKTWESWIFTSARESRITRLWEKLNKIHVWINCVRSRECRIWRFRESNFQNFFSGGTCPRTPYIIRAFGADSPLVFPITLCLVFSYKNTPCQDKRNDDTKSEWSRRLNTKERAWISQRTQSACT